MYFAHIQEVGYFGSLYEFDIGLCYWGSLMASDIGLEHLDSLDRFDTCFLLDSENSGRSMVPVGASC
jgi:hypothetical protein